MQDLISFTKNITDDLIPYIRNCFEENFALYSILKEFKDMKVFVLDPERESAVTQVTYLIKPNQNDKLAEFINNLNCTHIMVYDRIYFININKLNEDNIQISFTTQTPTTTPIKVVL